MNGLLTANDRFDLISIITGPGAVPYLETGDVITREEWRQIVRRFEDTGFMRMAFWFN